MTCRDLDELLSSSAALNEEAQAHIASCATCRSLKMAMDRPATDLNRSALDRIRGSVLSGLVPVRPLASARVFAALFICTFLAAALLGALKFGIYGWPALDVAQRISIFVLLVILAVLTAVTAARQMRPGAKRIGGGVLFMVIFAAIEAVFLVLFHDYSLGRFVHWGTGCLRAGLLCAIPVALLIWFLVRRGYVLNPVSAGAAIGCMAGLAGLTALEIHCPILTIPHVAVWHAAVVAISAAAGALAGLATASRTRSR
jgi:hypothetical protein